MPEESTTPDLVELTRHAYSALNSRDFDAIMRFFGPTSVWDASRWGLGTHAGLEAIRRFLDDWFGSLDEYQVQIEEIHDLGNRVIFVVVVQVAYSARRRGRIELRSAPVFQWVESVIERLTLFPDIGEARSAAERLAESRG